MADSFVDLLLVRLGKEEEKKKVLKLLIANLDLSVTEAESAVNNSPSVIREAVSMNEARAIQKDLYPYIDLLPRLEDETIPEKTTDEEEVAEVKPDGPSVEEEKDSSDFVVEDNIHDYADDGIENDSDVDVQEEEDEETIIITTASEEILSTNRCHICGRTPTDGERLAPCRTCGKLTCRTCFDRIAHVCNHCANEGKTVDRVNEGMGTDSQEGLEFDTEEEHGEKSDEQKSATGRIFAAVILFVLALAAVFYFLDPMGLFGEEVYTDESPVADSDSSALEFISADSILNESDTPADSTLIAEDQSDSTSTPVDPIDIEDQYGVMSLVLPADCIPGENSESISFHHATPSDVDADIPVPESEFLFGQLELIASSIPIVVDDGVFLVYYDTTSVLVLVLLHPEETGARIELMREVALWLAPSGIDQLVVIYRENRYQNAIVLSLVHQAFSDVEGVLSPSQFQTFLGYRDDSWESIRGPVTQWLSNME
ncbi:MAG: hypothetical protein KAH31_00590 [Candidatus Sabulitectum sp.]|nr:hypothetical protein [Candidatus Sabulitectum sp.]